MTLMRRIRVLSLPVLAALPSGAARAACNPTGTDVCCERTETLEIGGVAWPEADGVEVSRTCTAAAFELKGLREGRVWGTNVTAWVSSDTGVVCPPALRTPFEAAVEPDVVWEMTVGGTNRVSGSGTLAESPDPVAGPVQCVFTVRGETAGCGSRERTYEGEALVPATGFSLPDVVGRNDLVEPCADHTVRVGTIEELLADEEDLSRLKQWLPSPDAVAAVLYSETPGRLRVLAADGDELRDGCEYPEVPPDAPVWLEGVSRSETPGDARAALSVLADGIWCEASATTTVVSVEFDAACYNRMDPYPEVAVTEVSGLTPGGEALVRYAALPDVADPEGVAGEARFAVPETPGTYEWRTPAVRNRFGNEGWTTVRCTVRREADGTLSASWGSAGPSHRATVGPPEGCTADVRIGDALSETPEEAVAALDLRPGVALPEAHGTRPDYELSDVRIFRKAPTQWRTNELAMTELGVSALWAEHRGVTRASAVGLELSCDPLVAVNDKWGDGDSGEDADWNDPDLSSQLVLNGLPDCIGSGRYEWAVENGGVRLVVKADNGTVSVGNMFSGRLEDGIVFPKLEGVLPSETPDDVEVRFLLEIDGDDANPPAFRGKTFSARCRTTVTELRWTACVPDGAGGKSSARTDLLLCDLDLRPAVSVDPFETSPGEPLRLTGSVSSVLDVVRDVRINGVRIPLSSISFRGISVDQLPDEDALRTLAWGLAPPYEVRWTAELSEVPEDLRVEAFGSVGTRPGRWRQRRMFSTRPTAPEQSPKNLPSDPASFFGDFRYKLEIDHAGSGHSVLETEEDRPCVAQGASGTGLHRLDLPLLLLPRAPEETLSVPGPGLRAARLLPSESVGDAYIANAPDGNGPPARSEARLLPCDLRVLTAGGGGVPDEEEWSGGAFVSVGDGIVLQTSIPAGLSSSARFSLRKISDPSGVFPDFIDRIGVAELPSSGIALTASVSGVAEFELSVDDPNCTSRDRVRVTSLAVDLDIDSNNDNEFFAPDRSTNEEEVEAVAPGRILIVDDDNKDSDTIPDFADGYGLFPGRDDSLENEKAQFVPLILELPEPIDPAKWTIRISYSASNPMEVGLNAQEWYVIPNGNLRIWTVSGTRARDGRSFSKGGDWLAPGEYEASELGFDDRFRAKAFWLEAVRPSRGIGDLTVRVEAWPSDSDPETFYLCDEVVLTAVQLGLIPDWNRDGKITEEDRKRLERKGIFRFWINDDRDGLSYRLGLVSSGEFENFGSDIGPLVELEGNGIGFATDAQMDSPEGSYNDIPWQVEVNPPNYSDLEVNTPRDAIDFFTLSLCQSSNLISLSSRSLCLSQEDAALNFGYTALSNSAVHLLYSENLPTGFGWDGSAALSNAPVEQVSSFPIPLDSAWLDRPTESHVLMFEANRASSKPVKLTLDFDSHELGSWQMAFCSSSVQDMMRYVNIREDDDLFTLHGAKEGLWHTRTNAPANYPDGYYCQAGDSLETLISIHGLDWDADETPAGNAEIFKRCFQAGVNARFIGTSWASEIARVEVPAMGDIGPVNYGFSVIGAFVAAKLFQEKLHDFRGERTTILAHSLGNMVASSMINDYGFVATNYIMLNAAVPVEAYGSPIQADGNMVHEYWRPVNGSPRFPTRVMAAEWNMLFSETDPRSLVTWNRRFESVPHRTSVHQFYSSGENVLKKSNLKMPSIDSVMKHEYVWAFNELTKGVLDSFYSILISNHRYAGWRFNSDDYGQWRYVREADSPIGPDSLDYRYHCVWTPPDASALAALPAIQLIENPFFYIFDDEYDENAPEWQDLDGWGRFWNRSPLWIYMPDNTDCVRDRLPFLPFNQELLDKIKNHAKLLAEAIPPRSDAAGSQELMIDLEGAEACNMNLWAISQKWPSTRTGISFSEQNNRWLHGDYKDAPPFLTWTLYQNICAIFSKPEQTSEESR